MYNDKTWLFRKYNMYIVNATCKGRIVLQAYMRVWLVILQIKYEYINLQISPR